MGCIWNHTTQGSLKSILWHPRWTIYPKSYQDKANGEIVQQRGYYKAFSITSKSNMEKKAIQLTQNQYEAILLALGIAERKYSDTHKAIIDTLVSVRGNMGREAQGAAVQHFQQSACGMADLASDLRAAWEGIY